MVDSAQQLDFIASTSQHLYLVIDLTTTDRFC